MPKGTPNDPSKRKGAGHHCFKGNDVSPQQARMRCRYVPLGQCDECPAPAIDRHHKDGNTYNNERANIATLCRKCHMLADGRLAAFRKTAAENALRNIKPASPCVNCGIMTKRRWKGRCHRCNDYIRRTGIERPQTKSRLKTGKPLATPTPCPICSRETRLKTKGRCVVCYNHFRLHGKDRESFRFAKTKLSEPNRNDRRK